MDVGTNMFGMVTTNKKVFSKETIENITKDWPGFSYLLLRSNPLVPRSKPLIVIGYNYNVHKVLSFVVTEDAGRTKARITHLSKCPDPFYNVSICPIYHPLVTFKLFGYVNEFDSHNKSRKYYLLLENI